MRTSVLLILLSRAMWLAFFAQIPPILIGLAYGETQAWSLLWPALGAAAFGMGLHVLGKDAELSRIRRREGLLLVFFAWLAVVLVTSVGYFLSGEFAGFAQAFFESMSGYTTTGATVVSDIEALPHCILFARSFSHWVGGMGIIVLSVAILPELAVGGMQLFSAESTGIGTDKLAPRIAATARRLWFLYVLITAIETLLLWAGPMGLFDAVNHSLATIATGGFSTKNDSIAGFSSLYVEGVILVFMFISGINFTLQYRALLGRRPGDLLRSAETRLYIYLILIAIALISLNIYGTDGYHEIGKTLRDCAFTVVSIITTTGFGTADFETWPHFSQLLLVVLMLIGGCAGSTSGGSKVIRLYVLLKEASIQTARLLQPRLVKSVKIGDQVVTKNTIEGIMGYYMLYLIALITGSLLMTWLGMNYVSGTTASISALNSIGPGLDAIGPTDNFSAIPETGLYFLSFGMLLGRLEMYPLLVLFTVSFWRNR